MAEATPLSPLLTLHSFSSHLAPFKCLKANRMLFIHSSPDWHSFLECLFVYYMAVWFFRFIYGYEENLVVLSVDNWVSISQMDCIFFCKDSAPWVLNETSLDSDLCLLVF